MLNKKIDYILVLDLETSSKDPNPKLFSANPYYMDNKILADGILQYDPNNSDHTIQEDYCLREINCEVVQDFSGESDSNVLVVGANLSFDIGYKLRQEIWRTKIEQDQIRIWDVQIAHYILTHQQHLYPSLDAIAIHHGLPTKPNKEEITQAFETDTFHLLPEETKKEYLQHDVRTTWEIFKQQVKQVKERGLMPLIEAEMQARLCTIVMEYNGLDFNTDMADRLIKINQEKILGTINDLHHIYKNDTRYKGLNLDKDFSMTSPRNISAFLFGGECTEVVKEPVHKGGHPVRIKSGPNKGKIKTVNLRVIKKITPILDPSNYEGIKFLPKSNHFSVDESILKKIGKDSRLILTVLSFVNLVLEIKALSKINNTYLVPMGDMLRGPNNKIHTNIKHVSTGTRRLSSSNPNTQNIPDEVKATIQSEEKSILLEADYDTLELKCLADRSGDTELIKVLSDPSINAHEVTKDAFGVSYHQAKTFHYMLIFGAGVKAMAAAMGVTTKQMKDFKRAWWNMYPMAADYIEDCKRMARNNIYVTDEGIEETYIIDPLTRAGYSFTECESDYSTGVVDTNIPKIMNYPIQGHAGTILKIALSCVLEEYRTICFTHTKPILTVHDSIMLSIPDANLIYEPKCLSSCMNEKTHERYEQLFGVPFQVPLTVTVKAGYTWDKMEKV